MNIFFLDHDPVKAAEALGHRHVIKMILESCQLMCTTLNLNGVENVPYKPTHANHPSRLWVGESACNYAWLLKHTRALMQEYFRRYNKSSHKCAPVLDFCEERAPRVDESSFLTTPKLAMPDHLKVAHEGCVVHSYRRYFRLHKKSIVMESYNSKVPYEIPEWFLLDDKSFQKTSFDDREAISCLLLSCG